MSDIVNYIESHLVTSIAIISLIAIFIHSMFAVSLNRLNAAKYGKPTILAWIPGINVFLLGKLVVHWAFGIILFIGLLFGICISFNIPYLESIHSMMPENYVLPYQIGYGIIIVLLFIASKIKVNRMIRMGKSKEINDTFISRDYEKKEPEIIINKPVSNVVPDTKEEQPVNHVSLASLNTHSSIEQTSDDNKNP